MKNIYQNFYRIMIFNASALCNGTTYRLHKKLLISALKTLNLCTEKS